MGTGGNHSPRYADAAMNDLWVCQMHYDQQCQWQLAGAYDPFGVGIVLSLSTKISSGNYSNVGNQVPYPPLSQARAGALRLGPTSRESLDVRRKRQLDSATGLLNDLWEYDTSAYNAPGSTSRGTWVRGFGWFGSSSINQPGAYTGTLAPGARVNAAT